MYLSSNKNVIMFSILYFGYTSSKTAHVSVTHPVDAEIAKHVLVASLKINKLKLKLHSLHWQRKKDTNAMIDNKIFIINDQREVITGHF